MANILEIILRATGGDQVSRETAKVKNSTEELTTIFKHLGQVLTVGALVKGFQTLIKAYMDQELAVTRLNGALRSQGKFSEEISASFIKQASNLQELTTFADEAILSGQAFALAMGLEADAVKKVTPLVLDFASAMNIDLQTAFRIVGQSASGETSLLRRYGLIVDESKLKSDGFNAVLEVMQTNFGGLAEEIARSGVGPVKQFQNTISDLSETLGENLLPALITIITLLKEWLPTLSRVAIGISGVVAETTNGIVELIRIIPAALTSNYKEIIKIMSEHGKKSTDTWSLMAESILKIEEMAAKDRTKVTEKEEKDKLKVRVKNSKEWQKRIEETQEAEVEAREKSIKEDAKQLIDVYNFRRQLRELDLYEVISALEKESLQAGTTAEKRKIIDIALMTFRSELRLQEVVEVAQMEEEISGIFARGAGNWASTWEAFGNFVRERVLKILADEIVRVTGIAEALTIVLKGITGILGGGFGVLGRLLGFQHGGMVPGPLGQPTLAMVHGGEQVLTQRQQASRGGLISGRGTPNITIQINGNFVEADDTKWDRLIRRRLKPALQRELRRTGESFIGRT